MEKVIVGGALIHTKPYLSFYVFAAIGPKIVTWYILTSLPSTVTMGAIRLKWLNNGNTALNFMYLNDSYLSTFESTIFIIYDHINAHHYFL